MINMFGFKNNKVDEELLEKKYLIKTKEDFKKWLQNTYEALNYEQLEGVSKFAKEIYNINDEELANIVSNRFVRYFPVRTEPIPPPPRGLRSQRKVVDDASLMDKKYINEFCNFELDDIVEITNVDGLNRIADCKKGTKNLIGLQGKIIMIDKVSYSPTAYYLVDLPQIKNQYRYISNECIVSGRSLFLVENLKLVEKGGNKISNNLLKWTIDGQTYEVEGVVEELPKKYTLRDIKKEYIEDAKEFIKQSKEFVNKYGGWEDVVEDLTVYKGLQICISNLENKINEMDGN